MPKVASILSTTNDYIGAVAAVSEAQDDFRFVPDAYIRYRESGLVLGAIAAAD